MQFSWFLHSLLWKLWVDTPAANFNTHLNRQHVIRSGRNTHHWPAAVSMETTVVFLSWERVNSEWTWDYSYKLFPNLVISHFHAGMDIGLQVCWEWREDGLQSKQRSFIIWHLTGVHPWCSVSSTADRLWAAHREQYIVTVWGVYLTQTITVPSLTVVLNAGLPQYQVYQNSY